MRCERRRAVTGRTLAAKAAGAPATRKTAPDSEPWGLHSVLEEYLPFLTSASVETRELLHGRANDNSWVSARDDGKMTVDVAARVPGYRLSLQSPVTAALWHPVAGGGRTRGVDLRALADGVAHRHRCLRRLDHGLPASSRPARGHRRPGASDAAGGADGWAAHAGDLRRSRCICESLDGRLRQGAGRTVAERRPPDCFGRAAGCYVLSPVSPWRLGRKAERKATGRLPLRTHANPDREQPWIGVAWGAGGAGFEAHGGPTPDPRRQQRPRQPAADCSKNSRWWIS